MEKIEKVQTKFCKQYLALSQNTADFYALGECGRMPSCSFYFKKCVKYWPKLIMIEGNRYPKQRYMLLYRFDQAERKTLATHVRTLLYKFGFGYAWIS